MAVLFCGRCIQMVADRCRYSSIVGLCIYMLLLWNMFRGLSGKQHTWSSCSFLPNLIVSLLYQIFPSYMPTILANNPKISIRVSSLNLVCIVELFTSFLPCWHNITLYAAGWTLSLPAIKENGGYNATNLASSRM